MKPIAIILCAALCGAFSPPAPAAQPATAARSRVAQFDAAERALQRRLAAPEAARAFRQYNAAHGQQIQNHLAVVYAADPAYVADAGGAAGPLGDSIVGPVTLKWLARFCRDYGIVAGAPDFEHDVVASLEQVAALARAHPDWLNILSSADFDAWINEQPTPQRVQSLKMRRSGAAPQVNALIEQYLAAGHQPVVPPLATPPGMTYGYDPKRLLQTPDLARIVERLAPLARRAPQDEALFEDDVRARLDGMALDPQTLGLIKQYARVDVYLMQEPVLHQMQDDGLPEPDIDQLRKTMGGIEYENTQAFKDAYLAVADAGPDRAAFDRLWPKVVLAARLPRYQLPANLGAELAADAPLAPPIAEVFAGFRNVEYPTRDLFDKAMQWQVRRALRMCPDASREPLGALDGAKFDALAAALPAYATPFERIRALRDMKTACSDAELVEADALAYQVADPIIKRFLAKADVQIAHALPPARPRTNDWAVPGCGCGRDPRDGMVYGFYPLWTEAGERQIDFGALTRIGLFGLTMDGKGALRGPPGMVGTALPAGVAGLMRAAHKHAVAVDWVIARSDWSTWGRSLDDKNAVLETLRNNILALLGRPPQGGGQRSTRLASLGADPGPTGGDGIALYFQNFPVRDRMLFNAFVQRLAADFRGMRPARSLSVIVDYADLGTPGPYDIQSLAGLIEAANPLPKDRTFVENKDAMEGDITVLVMLPEPTRQTKRTLRGAVQDALHGTQSMRVLRAIVPVLEYDGVGWQQMGDDITYVSDNYYGIGFWPLPFAAPDDKHGLNRLLADYYQLNHGAPSLWTRIASILCPQRLWMRWLFWGALVLALIAGIVYFRCRGCNERLDSSGVYFGGMMALLGLPVLVLFLLSDVDPLLTSFEYLNIALGIGVIAAFGLVARYYFNEARKKLP